MDGLREMRRQSRSLLNHVGFGSLGSNRVKMDRYSDGEEVTGYAPGSLLDKNCL